MMDDRVRDDDAGQAATRMIAAQRRAKIIELVRQQGGASIEWLAGQIGTSTSTIRRDLAFLTEQRYLDRSRGGAVPPMVRRTTFEPDADIGSATAHAAKAAIGVLAAAQVEDGQSIIFDSSSTVLEAALRVVERDVEITAVTNDLAIAEALSRAGRVRLIVTGGSLRPRSRTLVGDPGMSFLAGLKTDLAMMGIHSLAGQALSETSTEVAAMKRLMIEAARRRVLLVDSSKFAEPSFTRVCATSAIHEVITDRDVPPAAVETLRQQGVKVTLAAPERRI
jgi:DeoR family transcriptional regulator of aga operon